MFGDEQLQTNAADPAQLAEAQAIVRDRGRRRAELWRRQLSTAEGREFVWDIVLRELGMFHRIAGSPEAVYGQAALHNLAVEWLRVDITPHRDLFLQMQNEALKRDAQEGKRARTARARGGRHDAGGEEATTSTE
jgi:hypothetical protein